MMSSKIISNILILATIGLTLLLVPHVAEAARGGNRGGTILWIPVVIIVWTVFFINKKFPNFWDLLFGLVIVIFLSFITAAVLIWAGIIEREQIIFSALIVFLLISFGPFVFDYLNNHLKKANDDT